MSVTITGVNQLFAKIDKIAKWSERDSQKLQAIGHRVADVYANYLKANIKDYGEDIRGTNKGKKFLIKSGQLRRSAGTWLPNKNKNNVMGGPRSKSIKPKNKTKKYSDGWFAHIVEAGDFGPRFGGKHRTQNTGVFSRGLNATRNRSTKLQVMLLRKEFARYVKAA